MSLIHGRKGSGGALQQSVGREAARKEVLGAQATPPHCLCRPCRDGNPPRRRVHRRQSLPGWTQARRRVRCHAARILA